MAKLRLLQICKQHRHQLIEARHQGFISIHVDYFNCEGLIRGLQGIQGRQHVFAQVAVGAGVQSEVHSRLALRRPLGRGLPL